MRRTLLTIGLMLATAPVFAKMQAKPVEWDVGKDHFSGYVVYDDSGKAKRPGLVMVPDWYGVTDSALEKAKQVGGKALEATKDAAGKAVEATKDAAGKAVDKAKELTAPKTTVPAPK